MVPWFRGSVQSWDIVFFFSGFGHHLGEDEGFGLRLLSSPRLIWGRPGLSAAAPMHRGRTGILGSNAGA